MEHPQKGGISPGTLSQRAERRGRYSQVTSWPEWSPPSDMARRVCRWDSGCSASRTGIATAPVDFVVESDRAQLSEIVQRVRDGRLRTNIGNVSTLDDAVAALNPTKRRRGKTIIRVRP